MEANRPFNESGRRRRALRESIIERLRQTPRIDDLTLVGLRAVMCFRVLALCSTAGREPVAELSGRLGSVGEAVGFLALADEAGKCWPENFTVMRPCCRLLSPDEASMAMMIQTARNADRPGFERIANGYLTDGAKEILFAALINYAAAGGHDT